MRSKICGQSIQKLSIFTGFFYLLQSILCSTALIFNLIKYVQDKEQATAQGITYDEDREVVSLLSVSISFSLTFVFTSPFLIWGSFKEKHSFLVPWLYNSFICLLVNSIYLFVTILKNIYSFKISQNSENDIGQLILMIVLMSVGLSLQIMFYKIVYKFYNELILERELAYLENSNTIFIVYDELNNQQS